MADVRPRQRRLLGHRYLLERVIGRGGMAEVYRARDRLLCRSVAVKVLHSAAVTETERARFRAEARTLARLHHPSVVTFLDAATTDDRPYLVMELIDGRNLAQHCRNAAMEPPRVAAIGVQLADALAHAHAAGVVHRDLKPGNVLLDADDRATLTDFGIARLMSETTPHTTTGVTVGTAAYLAPEQVRGDEITPASDVYSLGLVLLEALTGERTYRGTPVEAALARLTTPPAIPGTLPVPWQELLRTMTALDPTERPTADQVAASLRALASGTEPATAPPPVRQVHDRRARAAAGFAVVLAMMLLSSSAASNGGGRSTLPAMPQTSATVPAERHEVGSGGAEQLDGVAAAASRPLPSRSRSESGSPRPAKTDDREPERQAGGGQPIVQRDGEALDGSGKPVEQQGGKQKRDEPEKKHGKNDKKAKAAA